MRASFPPCPPYHGAAYYPEHWPLSQVDEDIRWMKEAGMNCMRIGEFAWSRMEPREGEYDFSWLHEVVGKLGEAGIGVILGTPTCTPPVWVAEKYPESLILREDGARAQHGARRHACPNSPVYRELCGRIVAKMADAFGHDPGVIGWQIDNELYISETDRGCCCPVCYAAFIALLEKRYGCIDALNAAWGLDLWSQAYARFDQIPIPYARTWHHPSLLTAWMAFQGASYVEFAEVQARILHDRVMQPVGTDMMPFGGVPYQAMHKNLDLVLYNHYDDMEGLWRQIFWFDYVRPIKPRPFWVTETQTCWNGSVAATGYKAPGFCRANAWMPIALGGEANLYWLWRTHWSGQELMHGSVLTSAGRPRHIFGEVASISGGYAAAGAYLRETRPEPARIGLHFSCWAWWLFEFQPQISGFKYLDALQTRVFKPLVQAQYRMDVLDPAAPLDTYRVILSPFLPSLEEEGLADRLMAWIRAGGIWIAGPLTDNRNLDAAKYRHAPFGHLEAWTGVRAQLELPEHPRDFTVCWADDVISSGGIWYDAFEAGDAEVLARYTEAEIAGLAAVVRVKVGNGAIIWLGTMPMEEDWVRLVKGVFSEAGIGPVADASSNVLVVPRKGGLVAVEYENVKGYISLPKKMRDLISGNVFEGETVVSPYGVRVLVEVE